jgi:hypothetical protein
MAFFFQIPHIFNLEQGWPTQIELWKVFQKKIDFLGHILSKSEEKTLIFDQGLSHRNLFTSGLATPGLERP